MTILAAEKLISITYSECMYFCLSYTACNAHAPSCHLSSGPALQYVNKLYHKRQDFLGEEGEGGKQVNEHKMSFLFTLQSSSETILILRRIQKRYYHKHAYVFVLK